MASNTSKTKKIVGIVVAIAIFVVWIIVDMYTFPAIAISLGYPVFELVAYGSWFAILLIMLAVLSITGAIPGRSSS